MSRRIKASNPIVYALAVIALAVGLISGQGLPAGNDADVSQQESVTSVQTTDSTETSSSVEQTGSYAWTTWDEEKSPNYVRLVGAATVNDELKPGEVRYSSLDALGRAGRVEACISYDMMLAGSERERSSDLPDPAGWPKNQKVEIEEPDGGVYRGYLWNRSHLLAKSLGGSDEVENLVSGTRMQNVGANDGQGGMALCETAVRDWLKDHPDVSAYYAATPVYEGDELICRSVFVDVKTSDGAIDEEVEVYNAAKGWSIDYATGEATPA